MLVPLGVSFFPARVYPFTVSLVHVEGSLTRYAHWDLSLTIEVIIKSINQDLIDYYSSAIF